MSPGGLALSITDSYHRVLLLISLCVCVCFANVIISCYGFIFIFKIDSIFPYFLRVLTEFLLALKLLKL